ACDNGIIVDEFGRTSDPAIVAVGDCTNHPCKAAGRRLRLESVQNAIDQAKSAAMALLDIEQAYEAVPWFWSDQYEAKLQIAGVNDGAEEEILRGDPSSGSFSVFYFTGGRLCGADSVNKPADHMAVRRLLTKNVAITQAQAQDEEFNLKSLLQ
ncbi:MAG: oxidoreductase C-terminal domain-containing protein, partial [Pseudomonadota bacterium]